MPAHNGQDRPSTERSAGVSPSPIIPISPAEKRAAEALVRHRLATGRPVPQDLANIASALEIDREPTCPPVPVSHAIGGIVPFECPRCHMRSWHPRDVAEGYCGACHDWTDGELHRL